MAINLNLEPSDLAPLVRQVVQETLLAMEAERTKLGDRLAFSEGEAAEAIGLEERQLADERRRGRIQASAIVGRRIRYTRQDLLDYLLSRRWEPKLNRGRPCQELTLVPGGKKAKADPCH